MSRHPPARFSASDLLLPALRCILSGFLTLSLTLRASSADLQVSKLSLLFILVPLNLCLRDMSASKKDRKNGHTAHLSLSACCGYHANTLYIRKRDNVNRAPKKS